MTALSVQSMVPAATFDPTVVGGGALGLAGRSRRSVSADGSLTLTAATPSGDPALWSRFVDGAWASYSRHGVSVALDLDEVASGATTAVFFVVLDEAGVMLGGVRAQGPYVMIEQSHVLTEWEHSPGLPVVAERLRSRMPHGIVEMKSAWVGDGAPGRAVSATLARTALPTMALTGSRYLFASAADHVLRQWETSGGVIDTAVPAAAYPSDRYRTRMMWWDRRTIDADAHPQVWEEMVRDARMLSGAPTGAGSALRVADPAQRVTAVPAGAAAAR